MPTFDSMRKGYENLFTRAQILPSKKDGLDKVCAIIARGRDQYEEVAAKTGVPWWWIGIIHMRESGCDFKTYLGNGQPLNKKTTLVPAGRGPFASWADGAIDAIEMRDIKPNSITDVATALYQFEAYNGWGYISQKVNSPYVWSWTNLYTSGKYVADHQFSSTAIDQQPGCAAMLIGLILEGLIPALAGKVIDMATSVIQPTPASAVIPPAPTAGVTISPVTNLSTHLIVAFGAIMTAMGILKSGSWLDALWSSQTISGVLVAGLAMVISHLTANGANANTIDLLDKIVVAMTPAISTPPAASVTGIVQPSTPNPTNTQSA